jgi:formylglycine-generating enzyme
MTKPIQQNRMPAGEPSVKTILMTLAGLLFLCGCSSEKPSAPPKSSTMSPPPANVGRPQSTARQTQAVTKPKPVVERPAPQIPPEALLVGGSEPNFLVVAFADASSEDRRLVFPPPIGLDSSFVIVENPAVEENAAAPIAPPAGFSAVESAGLSSEGRPRRIRSEKDGSEMAWVPAGPFLQGTDSGTPEAAPRHVIDLDGFYIDVHEVTLAQWQKYRESAKEEKRQTPPAPLNANGSPRNPAMGINWREASQYAKWVGKELPTEAEWEKAARGEKGFAYPWGDGRVIWESGRAIGQINDVGSFGLDQSPFGVMDLAGNAREWCTDWYADDAYRQLAASAGVAVRNWPGPKSGDKSSRRVVKGGKDRWEVWARDGVSMKDALPDVGLRCVLRPGSAPTQDAEPVAEASEPPPTRTPPNSARRPPEREPAKKEEPKKAPARPAF